MNAIKQKLHSRSGASLLLGLLFLFFCLMVGTVVLTAASANAGRLARNQQDRQDYLAVESAALLLRGKLEALHLEADYTTVSQIITTYSPVYDVVTGEVIEGEFTSTTINRYWNDLEKFALTGSELTALGNMEADFKNLFLATCGVDFSGITPVKPAAMAYPMTIQSDGQLSEVTASMRVETADRQRYGITLVLDGGGKNEMTLTMACNGTVSAAGVTETSYSDDVDAMTTVQTTTTPHTVTCTWQSAVITKGASTE